MEHWKKSDFTLHKSRENIYKCEVKYSLYKRKKIFLHFIQHVEGFFFFKNVIFNASKVYVYIVGIFIF